MSISAYKGYLFPAHSSDRRCDQIFRLRKQIFVDHYEWDIPSNGDIEVDQFDHDRAIYGLLTHNNQEVGVFRAIRCDDLYLSKTIFPELATVKDYPTDTSKWEISRFGVLPAQTYKRTNTQALYAFMLRFALQMNASGLVAIVERNHERLLGKFGIPTRRYGPPRSDLCTCKNNIPMEVVAGEIPMKPPYPPKFQHFLELANAMEIEDAASIFGPRSLSA